MKKLLILFPKSGTPTKTLDKDLKKIKNYDAGFAYKFKTVEYQNFHKLLRESIFTDNSCFIVLGELTEYGAQLEANGEYGPRRKNKGTPTIQDRDGTEIVLDLDDHIIEGFDALNPTKAITRWLRKRKIDCDVTWQITSGQKLNSEQARIRIYFETDKEHSLKERKAWSQSPEIMADGSVYTCISPIYTAPPLFDPPTIKDPIPVRTGFIKGKVRRFSLPKMEKEHVRLYSNDSYDRLDSEYDFTGPLPDEVLSGNVYRRYFRALAFSYVNKRLPREDVFALIKIKSALVETREFDADNVYEYIDHAIEKFQSEQDEAELADADDLDDIEEDQASKKIEIPEFPYGMMENWPAPWPMLWRTFKTVPMELVEELLVPTILSLNAYFLRCGVLTPHGRRLNFIFLSLAQSTGNKDVNSKNVIRTLDQKFIEMGASVSVFSGILEGESSISADTAFLQSFNENEELFLISTEATNLFQTIDNSSNASVAALSNKLIEVVDGHEISGKAKSDKKMKTIRNPNCQVLLFAQPETIEAHISAKTVETGLFGRTLLTIIPEKQRDQNSVIEFGKKKEASNAKVSPAFFKFYTGDKLGMSAFNASAGKKIEIPDEDIDKFNAFMTDVVKDYYYRSTIYEIVLSRLGIAFEKLYCLVLGICQKYDAHMGKDIREDIPVECLFPLMGFWAQSMIYAIENYIDESMDPLAEALMETLKKMLSGEIQMVRAADKKLLLEKRIVPSAQLFNKMKKKRALLRKLQASNDMKNLTERMERLMNMFARRGEIVKVMDGSRECYGIPKHS